MMYFTSSDLEICEELNRSAAWFDGFPMARSQNIWVVRFVFYPWNLGADVYVYIPKTKALTESF